MTNVIALKLTTDLDVLANLIEETDTGYETELPAYISIQPTQDGKSSGVSVQPVAATSKDGKVFIFKHAVAAKWIPDEKLAAEYNRIFFPGKIELINPGKIVV